MSEMRPATHALNLGKLGSELPCARDHCTLSCQLEGIQRLPIMIAGGMMRPRADMVP